MIAYRNDCVGCPQELGCIGSACPFGSSEVHVCDICSEQLDKYILVDGHEFCQNCAKDYAMAILQNEYDVFELLDLIEANYDVL